MAFGPIELLAIKFTGNRFKGEIVNALSELVDAKQIRIVDFLYASRNDAGDLRIIELDELDSESLAAIDPLVGDLAGLLSQDDVLSLATTLENGSSLGVMLFENTWATRFAEAVVQANGTVVFNERIPRAVIQLLELDAQSQEAQAT